MTPRAAPHRRGDALFSLAPFCHSRSTASTSHPLFPSFSPREAEVMPRIRFFILPPPFPLSPDCSVVVVVSFSSFSLYLVVRSVIGPAIRMDTQLFIPHDVGSPRIGRTGSEDKRTNIGFEWEPWCIITSRHQRGIFKFRMGLVGHLSQGLERKSSSMQKKEKERERQGERPIEREREEEERSGEGQEVKVRRRPVLPAHPRFRATAFLPSSSSSHPPPPPPPRRPPVAVVATSLPVCVHTYGLRGLADSL